MTDFQRFPLTYCSSIENKGVLPRCHDKRDENIVKALLSTKQQRRFADMLNELPFLNRRKEQTGHPE